MRLRPHEDVYSFNSPVQTLSTHGRSARGQRLRTREAAPTKHWKRCKLRSTVPPPTHISHTSLRARTRGWMHTCVVFQPLHVIVHEIGMVHGRTAGPAACNELASRRAAGVAAAATAEAGPVPNQKLCKGGCGWDMGENNAQDFCSACKL